MNETIALDERPVDLTLYGIGIRGRSALENVSVEFNGLRIPADYAGPSGDGMPGLNQVNVRIPASLRGSGLVEVDCVVDGIRSNVTRMSLR